MSLFTGLILSYSTYFLIVYMFTSLIHTSEFSDLWFNSILKKYSDYDLLVYSTFLGSTILYWSFCIGLGVLDFTGYPLWLYKYKMRNANAIASVDSLRTSYWKAIKSVLVNQFIFNLCMGFLFYRAWKQVSGESLTNEYYLKNIGIPSSKIIIRDLVLFSLMEEVGFYTVHRILHHPLLYKWIHKKHHEYISPIGAAAVYAHPVEHFVANLLPVTSSFLLLRLFFIPTSPIYSMSFLPKFTILDETSGHILTFWIAMILVTLNIICTHSGYAFPWLPDAFHHEYHHAKFRYNFGSLGIMDYILQTDSGFLKWREMEINKMEQFILKNEKNGTNKNN